MLYPYKFAPILLERVWGGHNLARFGKPVSRGKRIGESWEISDRDEAQSIVANGPDKGKTLSQIIEANGYEAVVGTAGRGDVGHTALPTAPAGNGVPAASQSRFPLLIKLLDCRERLSLQVHPPAAVAAKLKGEPKAEMWYVLEADRDSHLIAGLRRGVTGADFMRSIEAGQSDQKSMRSDISSATGRETAGASTEPSGTRRLEDLVHRFPVVQGDVFYVPSGRLHAIDAGVTLVEIQQNSDTTYRVYDWGRTGLDGKPRKLHVQEAFSCIAFQDFEPRKEQPRVEDKTGNGLWRLVECEHFFVHKLELRNAWLDRCDGSTFHALACLGGELGVLTPDGKDERLNVGEFILVPASLGHYTLTPLAENTQALKVFVPPRK